MKKRIAALLFAGILALAPAGGKAFNPTRGGIWQTVSAVEPRSAPATLVVGGENVLNGGYWTTDTDGNLTACQESEDWNVHYDGQGKLTLKDAYIAGDSSSITQNQTVGIYASNNSGDVSLTIELVDENEIFSYGFGIYTYSQNGDASLTIMEGEGNGSLTVTGSHGIQIQNYNGEAALNILDVDVAVKSSRCGVRMQTGADSTASVTVNGGSLTASGDTGDYFGG
ncbi:MAG TPA: hypothetical protein IAB37_06955, partial [Candidatus Faecivivens stercoravium]|nr:hypothetical protein [Candidatus Faecivivens stercoravium]